MTGADETPTVAVALANAMRAVQAVGKSERNKAQGFDFRGIDGVLNHVGPAFRDHGILVLPDVQSVDVDERQAKGGGSLFVVRLVVRYTFVGPAGDTLSVTVPAESFDSGDKATAKAMSVALRTALIQTLTIPTHDPDPDHDVYEVQPNGPSWSPAADDATREALLADVKALPETHQAVVRAWCKQRHVVLAKPGGLSAPQAEALRAMVDDMAAGTAPWGDEPETTGQTAQDDAQAHADDPDGQPSTDDDAAPYEADLGFDGSGYE